MARKRENEAGSRHLICAGKIDGFSQMQLYPRSMIRIVVPGLRKRPAYPIRSGGLEKRYEQCGIGLNSAGKCRIIRSCEGTPVQVARSTGSVGYRIGPEIVPGFTADRSEGSPQMRNLARMTY